ncbi:LD-carboxypeptidase [Maribacter chungangensis]|uniref:LD-carboxypeptidase n=1 Tax=Maribacter chungangensis TaxID=1069117 RepID=A0ABW3B6V3_9FLAO
MKQTRRNFFTGILGITCAPFLYSFGYKRKKQPAIAQKKILPKALKKGATIGLIAPGYSFSSSTLKLAKKGLKQMGYKTYHTKRISKSHGYFSNTDEERAADINELFANEDVDAILCIRGGYGCTRIMHLIDYDVIRKNPKALIGFSDVTALLNGIHKRTGLICFHGPVGKTINDVYSKKAFKDLLENKSSVHRITNTTLSEDLRTNPEYNRYTINPGNASGELVGGSLTLINALIGTPDEIDFTNKIVCIEDVGEAPYRIDRMLTQLIHGDSFKNASGIIFGVCAGCDRPSAPDTFTLKEVLMNRLKPLGIPSVYGMSFGHVDQNFTFPIGTMAQIDTTKMVIELQEAWVS